MLQLSILYLAVRLSTDVIIILKKFNCDPQTLHLSVYGKCIVVKLEIICST